MVIVEKHKEVLLYQDVNSFSNSVFAQQVPLVTNIQRQYTTVINTIVNPQSSVTINIPINLPYTIVNTVVYVQNLQINRISIDVNPTGLVLFQITSPIFTQITTYPNMTIPIYRFLNNTGYHESDTVTNFLYNSPNFQKIFSVPNIKAINLQTVFIVFTQFYSAPVSDILTMNMYGTYIPLISNAKITPGGAESVVESFINYFTQINI